MQPCSNLFVAMYTTLAVLENVAKGIGVIPYAGKFDRELNLAVWRSALQPPN